MKFLLDTNVYFALLYDPGFLAHHNDLLLRIAPRTYLSSVVRFELLQGARGDLNRARVDRATRQAERTGRMVAPLHRDWVLAGMIQGRIWDEWPALRTKNLQNDILIVCCARRIGAWIVTENSADFRIIQRRLPHRASSISELSQALET